MPALEYKESTTDIPITPATQPYSTTLLPSPRMTRSKERKQIMLCKWTKKKQQRTRIKKSYYKIIIYL